MRKLLISLSLMLVSGSVFAKGMDFFHGTFDEALAKAKQQDKLLFVDVYTDWCGPCKVMSKDVFPKDEVGAFYNAEFINYKLDAEKGEGPDVTERYPVAGYPTFWYIDGSGELVHRAAGGMDQKIFIELGREALGEGMSYEDMQAKYTTGDRDVKLVQTMLLKAPLYGQKFARGSEEEKTFWKGIGEMRKAYFASRKAEELINANDFTLIKTYLDGPNRGQPIPELVFSHYNDFANIVPEADVVSYIMRTHNQTIHELSRNGDISYKVYVAKIKTDAAVKKAEAHGHKTAEPNNKFAELDYYTGMSTVADMNYAQSQGNWKEFVKLALSYNKYMGDAANAMSYVNSANNMIFANCDDLEALAMIEPMTRTGYEMEKTTMTTAVYGKLLAKLGKKEEAKKVLTDSLSLYTGRLERMKPEIENLIKTL